MRLARWGRFRVGYPARGVSHNDDFKIQGAGKQEDSALPEI